MNSPTYPRPGKEAISTYFLENRARIIEIAAFLDRVDRSADPEAARADFRYQALLKALRILVEAEGDRTREVLLSLSDPTIEPRESAAGMKGAAGAWDGGSK